MSEKLFSSATAARDDLGRELPGKSEARKDRYVGMFYFLWCGEPDPNDTRPLDNTKLLSADPKAGYDTESPAWGKYSTMHHWGEPLFGYYYTRDEWVMRRHVEMLTRADIDFLVFDTTNALIYEPMAKIMMRILSEYRAAGFNTPKVVFYTNSASGATAQKIYDGIYAKGYCADSWFYVDGKPVIIAKADECSEEVREFFTIRASQWPNEPTKRNGWPWMDFVRPQRVLENYRGEPEIINVSVAQHPQIFFGDSAMYGETQNRGRSFHNGANDPTPGAYKYGYNFAEQWDRAIETDPPYVFVTGWNEWIAGRWGGSRPDRPLGFVDCCNLEYSRDIEPMRGGYFDNYYMQLISYVRKYKGYDTMEEFSAGQTAAYRDFPHGGTERCCIGYGNTEYVNRSGRNQITECTVCDDGDAITFTAECSDDITANDYQSSWMQLYIGVEGSSAPSCCGVQFIANTYTFTDNLTALSRCTEDSRTMEADTFDICAKLDYSVSGKSIQIKIPKNSLGIECDSDYSIRFKWADSKERITRMEDFYTSGDCAPIGRLFFRYGFKA